MKQELMTIVGILIIFSIFTVGAVTIDSVSISPKTVVPGKSSAITLEIKNNGERTINDVLVSLDLSQVPFAPFDSAGSANIDEIKKDRIKSVNLEIIALNNAASGIYKIPVQISYNEDTVMKTSQSLISVSVNSEPVLSVDIEDRLLLKGQENQVSFKIVNKGLSDAKFLEAGLGTSNFYKILSSKNIYIGDLSSNDFDSAQFNIFINANAQNTINMPVTLKFRDPLNNEYTQEFTVQIRAYSTQEATSLGLIKQSYTSYIILMIIILIIIIIIYRRFSKRRKLKKAKEEEAN
jgi:hypothetical protein